VFIELSAVSFDSPSIIVEHGSYAQWWHDAFNLMDTSAINKKSTECSSSFEPRFLVFLSILVPSKKVYICICHFQAWPLATFDPSAHLLFDPFVPTGFLVSVGN